MGSISSAKKIKERTYNFWSDRFQSVQNLSSDDFLKAIETFLKEEYQFIPEKERIGKGVIYVARYSAKETFNYFKTILNFDKSLIFSFGINLLEYAEIHRSREIYHYGMLFLFEILNSFPDYFEKLIEIIKKWATDDEWEFRESVIFPLMAVLRRKPSAIISIFEKWSKDDNDNIRRLVVESLRPKAAIKWLRDPSKNDEVLKILTTLNHDPSIYVRKAVGNNLKDLTKYMPDKILNLMETWIRKSGIQVHDQLATEIGLDKEEKRLLWTMKQAMRWIKDRMPEYHEKLEKLLGSYYLLYFNEKTNRLAKPP